MHPPSLLFRTPHPPKLHLPIPSNTISATRDRPPSPRPPSSHALVKLPPAPWMRGPLLLPFDQLPNLSPATPKNTKKKKKKKKTDSEALEALTEKFPGGRSRQAMKEIIRNISHLQEEADDDDDGAHEPDVQLDQVAAKRRAPPWVRAEEGRMRAVFRREKKERAATRAEILIPELELRRLRREAGRVRDWVKGKKAGVTEEVVEEIKRRWRRDELVKVRVVEPLRRNMDRAREIVETKTGGLVVVCKNDTLVVYRGNNYQLTTKPIHGSTLAVGGEPSSSKLDFGISEDDIVSSPDGSILQKEKEGECCQLTGVEWTFHNRAGSNNETLYEREANRLLDGLGPRFIDWWWQKPLPVDADLLPEVVPDFKPPFRLCPPHERPKLSDDELTYLRKFVRPLPTHFALGKNTRLQGVAAAIIKLWEKSLVAKIAVKVGVPGTNNQQMSLELKRLTGGVVILRNKYFIILYRGKDFLPGRVANSVHEREKELHYQHIQEEEARSMTTKSCHTIDDSMPETGTVGTFSEFCDIQANYLPQQDEFSEGKVKIEAEKEKLEKELRDQEHKLLLLKRKIEKSEEELAMLNSSWSPSEQSVDSEIITEEERQAFRKIGLKMDEFLLLGRRGIYNGVLESIHQHWKHREVVKVITMQKMLSQITYTAGLLEIESGGILVAVEKLKTGHAIIIYRGKNYSRPLRPLPGNLLTKREALQRSIEVQRRGSLKYFAHQRQKAIWELKLRLRDLEKGAKELIMDP